MRKKWFWVGLIFILSAPAVAAAETSKTYTNHYFLYSIDYPETWRSKEISKVAVFTSPYDSVDDKFAENVSVVAEDLSQVPVEVSLIDYHRKAIGGASKMLTDFNVLEEAQTQWIGRDAIIVLYTATLRGEKFKFKAYTVMVDKTAYVLTYTAREADFENFLPEAERLMRSIRVSP